jgi:AcrR family transcriptional regulator
MAKSRSKALRSLDEFAQAGVQCFLRGGYRLTQVADVSAAMGMSAGAIYRYIEGKEALFDISVHYAAHLPISEKHIPVKVGSIDDTIRAVRMVAGRWKERPHLNQALASKKAKDLRLEAANIGIEIYDLLSSYADFIGLLNRCAHDIPELLQVFNEEIKTPLFADIATWFQRRSGVDSKRSGGQSAAVARAALEAVAWLANVRKRDETASSITDEQARVAASSMFVNLFPVEAAQKRSADEKRHAAAG